MTDENRLNDIDEPKPSLLKRALAILLVTVLLLGGGVYGAGYVLFRGPFVHAQAAFVQKVNDSPAGSAVIRLFVSEQQRDVLLAIDAGTGITAGHEKSFSVYPNSD